MKLSIILVALLSYVASADISGSVVLNSTMNQSIYINIMPDSSNKNTMGEVNMVLTGNINTWFGVGFNNSDMRATYSIIVDESGITYEYYLGSGTCSPGCDEMLKPTYTLNSVSVMGQIRTVNITRPLNNNINGAAYFNFPSSATDLLLIWAYGVKGQLFQDGTAMGYHGETHVSLK